MRATMMAVCIDPNHKTENTPKRGQRVSPLNGVVFPLFIANIMTPRHRPSWHPLLLGIAPWHINRQRHLIRCMWNRIRVALAQHRSQPLTVEALSKY